MCDQSGSSNYSPWNTDFYHQYLQQHARLTEWILNLHQNLPQTWPNPLDHQNHVCHHNHHQNHVCCHNHHQNHVCHHNQHQPVSQGVNYIPHQRHHYQHQRRPYIRRRNTRQNSRHDSHHRIGNGNEYDAASVEYVGDNGNYVQEEDNENGVLEKDNENDAAEEHDEDDDSEGEWVFNIEPLMAFRAENEKEVEEDTKSEASIVLIDAVLDENFEFIQLDDAGQMQKVCDRPSTIDAKDDLDYDKSTRTFLYGDRADRIAGLETSLEIMFDHISDLHEPIVYPLV
ncbi:uncharacterized protein LOC129972590 [Argiope bruennichi]|uniref:uncharacterized protein LOC129972590 n=1 Tax=Argiope bruennichi TaxID=94029 RepID=UPI002493FE09|nr:uncharacterized protein LOC129972590 [Argiope bruennichi]